MPKRKKKNQRKRRSAKKRVLIMCEGDTERNYFYNLKEDVDWKNHLITVDAKVVKAPYSSPDKIVTEAKKEVVKAKKAQNEYNIVWLVFDHDNHSQRQEAYDDALKEDFKIAFSAMCFEEWYLLHFQKSTKAFSQCKDLVKELQNYYPDYQKAKRNDFKYLKDKLEIAIKNAKWLKKQSDDETKHITNQNPWTDVDVLIEELKSFKS